MTRPRLFITRRIPDAGLDLLSGRFDIELWPEYGPPPAEALRAGVAEADAMISLLSDRIDAALLDAAPRLKMIAQYAVGYDNIDVKAARARGILVSNTPDVLTDASADFAWALLMAIARRVVEADRHVREGKWQVAWHPAMLLGRDVAHSTIGIIGAGRIGQAVGRRAKGFSMNILYCSSSEKHDFELVTGAKHVDLDTLLRESDFVSLHVPLTEHTRNMINAEKLALMKPGAYLINNSRGPVIDEKALYQALKNGHLAGAGLDVFTSEPTPTDNPLLELDNVVVAPHISSAGKATRDRMSIIVARNLLAWLDGHTPENLVLPS
ncbi:MAG: 2-hydroxyacid dehydrogenase [Candidatus Rifleibacteriota bacterium]